MAVDMFLKLAGIKGESLDHKHKDEIEVLSFSFGISQTHAAGGGGAAGKVQFQDFRIVKNLDTASPDFFDFTCSGRHIQNGVFTVGRSHGGKDTIDYYKISFEDVLISSVSPAGNMGDVPMEQVSFNFASVKVEARRQSANGSFGPWETTSCDLAAQKE